MPLVPLTYSAVTSHRARRSGRRSVYYVGLLLLCAFIWSALPTASAAQTNEYTFVLRGVPLDQALEAFSSTTGLAVAYTPRLAEGRNVYCVAEDEPAEAVLRCILKESNLDFYRLSSGTYVLTAPPELPSRHGYLTGLVADRATGAPIANAHVQLANAESGTITNSSGRFSFPPLLPGQYVVRISHVGYHPWQDTLRVTARTRTRTEATLRAEPVAIKPVVIDGIQPRYASESLGRARTETSNPPIGWAAASQHGMRQLNALPGVRISDLTADIHVQGGRTGDHQMRLDGVPVHLPRTLLGLIGPFSPFAIDRISVEKAGFGAAAGSQMAGIIDATHTFADEHRADLQVDPLSLNARLQLAPSFSDAKEIAVMTAARVGLWGMHASPRLRTTLADWSGLDPFLLTAPASERSTPQALAEAIQSETAPTAPAVHFADLHAATRIRLSPLRTLHISAYRGHRELTGNAWSSDDMVAPQSSGAVPVTVNDEYRWGNLLGQVRYDAVLGNHTLFRAQLRGSRYRLRHEYSFMDSLSVDPDAETPRIIDSNLLPARDDNRIHAAALDVSIDHAWRAHHVRAGTELTRTESMFGLNGVHLADAEALNAAGADEFSSLASAYPSQPIRHTASDWRWAAFASDRISLADRWEVELGVRITYQPDRATAYAEPRLSMRYDGAAGPLGPWSMRTAAGLYRQFTYQTDASVLNAGALLPSIRVWLPLDASVAPPRAYHFTHEMLVQPHPQWRLRAEGYFKHQPHHLALRYAPIGKDPQSGPIASQQQFLTNARGRAYGGSLSATWEGSQVKIRALYEYSRAVRRSPALFDGRTHSAPWNTPHRAELGVDWTPTSHLTVSVRGRGVWKRSWGFRRVYYDYFGHSPDTRFQGPFDLGRPSDHTLPPLYQLDASLAYAHQWGPVTLQARLEVLNAANRANVADWHLVRGEGQWRKAPRYLYPRLPMAALRLTL